ncbi:sugar transferase, partial [Campylobacter coli]|nr:sugar transferase [Campylobacter coli]
MANTAFPYPLLGGSSTIIRDFPDITEELKKDILTIRESNMYKEEKLQSFISFFTKVQKKYNIIKSKSHYNFVYPNSAKIRIQNQLSYKLGQAMIVNSKSMLGYIRMPFVLSYIYDKHKQEQKIYQEKIKKDSSL